MRTRTRWVFSFLAVVLLAASAPAQVLTGTLTGTVTDATDAVIPGAAVTVTDLTTGREYSMVTDGQGVFTFTNLPNGFYKVVIEAQGFGKFTAEKVQIYLAQTAKVIARLEVATVGTEVSVVAQQSVLQSETSELKNSVDRAQIINLPLPGRNPLDLVKVMPGVVSPTSSGIGDAFVHGLRGNSTNITQDGINVADNFVKTSAFFAISAPTVDAVGEFNVSIGGIGVDAGFGAAQVNIRTHRGANDFHGSLFWFHRNDNLNANTWFNNASRVERPFLLRNWVGANAGGPVYIPKVYNGKNRTFVFGNVEYFREPLARSRTRSLMTSEARTGLFTYTGTDGARRQVNLLSLGTIGNTGVTPAINRNVMDFYNSIVPTDGLTDAGCAAGDAVNIRCLRFNLPGKAKQERYTLRVDHQLNDSQALEFVFNQADFDSNPDLLNGIEPQFPKSRGGSQSSRRQVLSWAWQSIWGPYRTNEVRVGYQRAPVGFNLFNDYSDNGGYQLTFATVTDPNFTQANLPQGRNTPVRQVIDNFSWIKATHHFRFGGEYRQVLANNYFYNTVVPRVFLGVNPANPNGITADKFAGGINAGDLARANAVFNNVTGLLANINQGFNHTSPTSGFVPGKPREFTPIQHNISGYFQDSYKFRPNLTLQLGVRYELQGVFDSRNQLILLPQDGISGLYGPAGLGNLFNPLATPVLNDTLLNFAGGRNDRPIYQRDINNFAPYLGFAWNPGKDRKSAIRGAFTTHFPADGFTFFSPAVTGNTGLFSVLSNTTPTGTFRNASNPTPAAPVAAFPVSQRANFIANTGAALWNFDNSLKTPYVMEWSFGVQRELFNRVTIEARYVGNHAVKSYRAWDINELDFYSNNGALVREFRNAQQNLTIGRTSFANQGMPGQVALPTFERLFTGLPAGSGFGNAGFLTNLRENQVGTMFDTVRRSNTYRVNREANFPLNYFVANPFANDAIHVDNSSWSYWHGLEVEVNRRFSSGVFFATNYTFSKVLTDQRFLTSQNEFQEFRSLRNRRLDKNRAQFDVTHSFAASVLYPLPIGRGKYLARSAGAVLDRVVGGWQLFGTTRWFSGAPFNILSNRNTTGSLVGSTAVLRNMTASELQKQIGVFRGPTGVYWLNPQSGLFNVTGGASRAVFCTSDQTTPCFDHPGVNGEGNLPFLGFNSPRFFSQDFSVVKKTNITERVNFDIRCEIFNAFNVPNFAGWQSTIDGATFGQLTTTLDTSRGGGVTSRIIQMAVRLNW